MKNAKILAILVLALGLLVWLAGSASAAEMGTAITYQGRLIDANTTADGLYDFAFKLYDTNVGGSKAANDVNVADVDVIDGYFTVELDFNSPSAFNGEARWLEIGVRPGEMNDPNAYTTLSPRQEITPTPYALQTRGIFVDNDGNVGIGTRHPSKLLHIVNKDGGYDGLGICLDPHGFGFTGGTTWHIDNDNDFKLTESRALPGYPRTRFTISDGNIGIGTTSPGTKLHVYEPSSSDVYMSVEASSSDGEAGVRLKNPAGGWDVFANNDDGDFGIAHALSDRVLTMKKTTGNVGIGTTSPGAKLQVGDTSAGHDVYIAGSTSSQSGLFFYDGSIPGGMRYNFSTDDLSIFTAGTARLMINSSGNVGIGTTNPQHKVHVSGNVYTSGNTYTAGKVGVGTTSPGWEVHVVGDIAYTGDVYDISDSRLKENITPLRNAIEKVSSLCGIYFNNKGESPSKREVGVIAQDVEAVLPEVVSENNEGYKVVAYSKLTALLIEAVKEQQKQIESLEQRIENLENTASRSRLSAAKEIYNGTN